MKKGEPTIKGNSLGAVGFVLGILSILTSGFIGLVMSVVGFIFCFIQQKNKSTKLGVAGLILNIIGFVFSIVWIFYLGPIVAEWITNLAAQLPTS